MKYFLNNLLSLKLSDAKKFIFCPYFRFYIYLNIKYLLIRENKVYNEKIDGFIINFTDPASFISSFQEIYITKLYALKNQIDNKLHILEGGANIGLSIIYFKYRYPDSIIDVYEADKLVFELLKKNIEMNKITGVSLFNKAIWNKYTTVSFLSDGSDGGKIIDDKLSKNNVEAIDLRDILNKNKYSFVKLDIEGAEEFILPDLKQLPKNIKYFFIEYHSSAKKKQNIADILTLFKNNNFRIHIQAPHCSDSPFQYIHKNGKFDMQLHIFGNRDV